MPLIANSPVFSLYTLVAAYWLRVELSVVNDGADKCSVFVPTFAIFVMNPVVSAPGKNAVREAVFVSKW